MAETQSFGRRTAAAKAKQKKGEPKKEVNWVKLIAAALVGIVIWFIPAPAGLEAQAWHMFAIFVATIVALIIKPMPMGAIAIVATILASGRLSMKNLEIRNMREVQSGALRVEFYDGKSAREAAELLRRYGYTVYER